MRIYSFSTSAGHQAGGFGNDFVLSPLTSPDGTASVACFHLAAGGYVGEHEAVVGQLFCVVEGQGWVSGRDGRQKPIHAQQAAYWEPGEMHAAGSDSGLIAIVVEGNDFEVMARESDNDP